MQLLTGSSASSSSWILPGACGVALLFTLGCIIVPLCGAAKPAAPSPTPSKKVTTAAARNPFLTESTLPYQMPPFDKIKDEHFQPALEQGIVEEEKEAEAIAQQTAKPTFENTIVALEKMGQLIDRARRTFSNFTGANTNPTLQKIEKEMAPKFSAHADSIHLNGPLFARIETLYNDREKSGLDSESKWLLERYYKDFVRAGAKLSEADKTKLKALNAELATLQTTFEQNVLKEKNASSIVVNDRAELAGLLDNEIAAAASAAKADGKEGKFVIRLLNTTGQPSLASLQDRPLREKIMQT